MHFPGLDVKIAALQELDCAVTILDETSQLCYVNSAWQKFCVENGGPEDGYVGASYLRSVDISLDPKLTTLERALQRLLKGELDELQYEYPCDAPGERRWFIMKATAMTVDGVRWIVMLHVQVGAARNTIDSLRAGGMEQYEEFKDKMLRLVSHQFRTPLTPIAVDLKLLETRISADGTAALARMQRNVDRLNRIIESSLALLKLEQDNVIKRQGRMAVLSLRQSVEAAAARGGYEARIQLEYGNQDAPISMDLAWTGRAVQEVLDNCIRESTASLEVKISLVGGNALLDITDTGAGWNGQQEIFSAFSVTAGGENTTSRAGLGLAVAQTVVELHGGAITGVSKGEGLGATFRISLPLIASKRVGPLRPPRPAADNQRNKKRGSRNQAASQQSHSQSSKSA